MPADIVPILAICFVIVGALYRGVRQGASQLNRNALGKTGGVFVGAATPPARQSVEASRGDPHGDGADRATDKKARLPALPIALLAGAALDPLWGLSGTGM
jgi:hypothetical protein